MRTWDIFCDVIDNYGDIGVCWRLARQLANEHHIQVRLIVNDLTSFKKICPQLDVQVEIQNVANVAIYLWNDTLVINPAEVVVEAFACSLPPFYIDAMVAKASPPTWINLEYLSAESWVEDCHLLPSPQVNGLKKYFYFPGFTDRTGGLLREDDLITQRDAFSASDRTAFLDRLGVTLGQDEWLVSLFTYGNNNIADWLSAIQQGSQPCYFVVPPGPIVKDISHWLGVSQIEQNEIVKRGNLTLHFIPFLPQPDFDRLLWSCDFNFVRGEDSLVRAIWAAKPFLWHIYKQDDDVHLNKLEAFLDHFIDGAAGTLSSDFKAFWMAWNTHQNFADFWSKMLENYSLYEKQTENYAFSQINRPSLTKLIANF